VFLPLVAGRWMSTTRKDVGGAACHEHGAVFASAARVPLTSVASVVEMTGDFTLTLPVMLDVEIGTSRGLSYGTIYTTKLLRRGTDIDRVPSADPVPGPHRRRRDAPLPGAARRGERAVRPARRAGRRPSGSGFMLSADRFWWARMGRGPGGRP
jgi:Voltage gated chloride channel